MEAKVLAFPLSPASKTYTNQFKLAQEEVSLGMQERKEQLSSGIEALASLLSGAEKDSYTNEQLSEIETLARSLQAAVTEIRGYKKLETAFNIIETER